MELDVTTGFGPRFYREGMGHKRFISFVINYKDSDLWIGVSPTGYATSMKSFATRKLIELRSQLEDFIQFNPQFGTSYTPVCLRANQPEIATEMCLAAERAGTGPMAAVAGAFAAYIGKALLEAYAIEEIVVENGGDIFLHLKSEIVLSVYAGASKLSSKIGIKVPHDYSPLGVCTSAGRVGPSVSFGKADAVVVACKNTALADAYATALGNIVRTGGDIPGAIEKARNYAEILSVLIICEDQLGISGQFELVPLV